VSAPIIHQNFEKPPSWPRGFRFPNAQHDVAVEQTMVRMRKTVKLQSFDGIILLTTTAVQGGSEFGAASGWGGHTGDN
jgi:hypothetical protein